MNINYLEFKDTISAWAGINEFLAKRETLITKRGGGIYGPELISYNNFIRIRKLRIDPNFDFGKVLGYKDKKWSSLVNNYVDFNYLDLIKSELALRTAKKARNYNYAYHFNNTHGSGKDCLISLNFTKRIYQERPVVVYEVRTSEVTKRLIFDLLLVQRMVEYVYGPDQDVEMHFIAPSFFITAEHLSVYNNHRPIKKVLRKYIKTKTLGKFQTRILDILHHFSTVHPKDLKYKMHKRSAAQLQFSADGVHLSKVPSMLAKDLNLMKPNAFPEEVISPKSRTKFKRAQTKANKK